MKSCQELSFRIADTILAYEPDDTAMVVLACLRVVGCYLQKVAKEESGGDAKEYNDMMDMLLLMSAGQLAQIIKTLNKGNDNKVMH